MCKLRGIGAVLALVGLSIVGCEVEPEIYSPVGTWRTIRTYTANGTCNYAGVTLNADYIVTEPVSGIWQIKSGLAEGTEISGNITATAETAILDLLEEQNNYGTTITLDSWIVAHAADDLITGTGTTVVTLNTGEGCYQGFTVTGTKF